MLDKTLRCLHIAQACEILYIAQACDLHLLYYIKIQKEFDFYCKHLEIHNYEKI